MGVPKPVRQLQNYTGKVESATGAAATGAGVRHRHAKAAGNSYAGTFC